MANSTASANPDIKFGILEQARQKEIYTLALSKAHFSTATIWGYLQFIVGIPNTILAAIAGASAFSKVDHSSMVAGGLSILVAILTALSTFLDPNERAKAHWKAGNEFQFLNDKFQILVNFDSFTEISPQQLKQKLEGLLEEFYKARAANPVTPYWAWKQGLKDAKQQNRQV